MRLKSAFVLNEKDVPFEGGGMSSPSILGYEVIASTYSPYNSLRLAGWKYLPRETLHVTCIRTEALQVGSTATFILYLSSTQFRPRVKAARVTKGELPSLASILAFVAVIVDCHDLY